MTSPKRVDTFGRLILVIVFGIAVWVLSSSTIRPFLSARRDLQAFRRGVHILSDAAGSVERLNAEIRRISQEVAATKEILPQDVNLDAFLLHLGDLGQRTGVRMEKLIPHNFAEHRRFRELIVEVDATGPFLAVYNFLDLLEGEGQLSRIEELSVEQRDAKGPCRAKIRLALYFASDEEARA
jgi:Tfp pilus assembly protein PilO